MLVDCPQNGARGTLGQDMGQYGRRGTHPVPIKVGNDERGDVLEVRPTEMRLDDEYSGWRRDVAVGNGSSRD